MRSRTVRQFDVLANPFARARAGFPFIVVLQSDLADTGAERLVAPLVPRAAMPPLSERVTPVVRIDGQELRLLLPRMTSLNAGRLSRPVGSLKSERNRIVAALDYLFLGF